MKITTRGNRTLYGWQRTYYNDAAGRNITSTEEGNVLIFNLRHFDNPHLYHNNAGPHPDYIGHDGRINWNVSVYAPTHREPVDGILYPASVTTESVQYYYEGVLVHTAHISAKPRWYRLES